MIFFPVPAVPVVPVVPNSAVPVPYWYVDVAVTVPVLVLISPPDTLLIFEAGIYKD